METFRAFHNFYICRFPRISSIACHKSAPSQVYINFVLGHILISIYIRLLFVLEQNVCLSHYVQLNLSMTQALIKAKQIKANQIKAEQIYDSL